MVRRTTDATLEGFSEADLESLIVGARDAQIEAEKPRYACAGSRRIDDTGKKFLCDYRAVKKRQRRLSEMQSSFRVPSYQEGKEFRDEGHACGAGDDGRGRGPISLQREFRSLTRFSNCCVVYCNMSLQLKTRLFFRIATVFRPRNGRKAYFASGEMTKNAGLWPQLSRLGIVIECCSVRRFQAFVSLVAFRVCTHFGARFLAIDSVQVAQLCTFAGYWIARDGRRRSRTWCRASHRRRTWLSS